MTLLDRVRGRRAADRKRQDHAERMHRLCRDEAARLRDEAGEQAGRLAAVLEGAVDPPPSAVTAADRIERQRPRLEQLVTPLGEPYGEGTTVGQMARRASGRRNDGLLLHSAATVWQPQWALEMGTCCGVSGAYIAAALQPNGGRLLSLELSPILARTAEWLWDLTGVRASVRVGDFADTFEPALDPVPSWVFVDGNHKHDPTWHYFERLTEVCPAGSLLIFDDIAWSEGMASAWAKIRADERTAVSADVGSVGFVVTT
jgi:predicted O-methyltransferase YrrM